MVWILAASLLVPLFAAVASLWRQPLVAETVTVAGGALALGLAIAAAILVRNGDVIEGGGDWLRLDSLGAVFLLATGFLYAVASVFSIGYLRADARRSNFPAFARRYFALLNLFALTMIAVPLMSEFSTLWIAVELTTIVSVLLVALDRTDAALEAAWKYVLLASVGLGIALLALIVLYAAGIGALGDTYVPRFASYLAAGPTLPLVTVKVAFLLSVLGFGTKAGLAPLHTWLPDAHSEAPTSVSALLSGALLANALYAILRFYQVTVAAGGASFAREVLLVFGTLSLLVAALFVLKQENYKRLLAYSSIEHVGVIAIGVGFGVQLAVVGALLHVIGHAAAKSLAFFGTGSILRRFDSKEVDRVRGAAWSLPWSGPMFLAGALALSALPLSALFRSEFQIVAGGFARPAYAWAALLVVLVNVAFLGVVWHAGRMVLARPGSDTPRGETSWWIVAAMAVCLAVVVGLGLHLPAGLHDLLSDASRRLTTPPR